MACWLSPRTRSGEPNSRHAHVSPLHARGARCAAAVRRCERNHSWRRLRLDSAQPTECARRLAFPACLICQLRRCRRALLQSPQASRATKSCLPSARTSETPSSSAGLLESTPWWSCPTRRSTTPAPAWPWRSEPARRIRRSAGWCLTRARSSSPALWTATASRGRRSAWWPMRPERPATVVAAAAQRGAAGLRGPLARCNDDLLASHRSYLLKISCCDAIRADADAGTGLFDQVRRLGSGSASEPPPRGNA